MPEANPIPWSGGPCIHDRHCGNDDVPCPDCGATFGGGDHEHRCRQCAQLFDCEEPDCDDTADAQVWACPGCPWPEAPPYDAATATGMYD